MYKNRLLILVCFFLIAINNLKADQGDLEKLYRAISKELNIGTYEDFKAKMQTAADRKRFYEMISEQYDLGTYEIYEKRLSYLCKDSLNSDFLIREYYLKLKGLLLDYVATANSGKYKSWDEVYAKFPEFSGYDQQVLTDYVATANSGKYKSIDEVNAKFPEFFNTPYSKRDSIKLVRQAVYLDMIQELAGISFEKFIENLSKDENVRRSVYRDMRFAEESMSYERFLNKMGLDYKRQLWEDLNKKRFYTKSFQEFENQFSTPDKLQALFDKLVDGDYFKGSYLDFIERYFSDIGNTIYTFLKANNLTVKNEKEFVEEYAQNTDKQKMLYNFFQENDLTTLDEESFFRKYCPEWTIVDDGLITKDKEVNHNDLLVNVNWKIIVWIVIGLTMIALIWYSFKTGVFRKIFNYLSDVFQKNAIWIRKNRKRIGISLALILSIAIVTNPSVDTFKSFLRSKGYPKNKIENLAGRYANFYLFSVYKYQEESYLGFFGNFVKKGN